VQERADDHAHIGKGREECGESDDRSHWKAVSPSIPGPSAPLLDREAGPEDSLKLALARCRFDWMSMLFTPPIGVAFHTEDEVRGDELVAAVRRVVAFLEGFIWTPNELRVFDDRWEHDGLHFERKCVKYADLFAMIASPRAMLDATPDDDCVYVGIAPEEARWYLRFRAVRDETYGEIVGAFGVVMPEDYATLFKLDVEPRSEATLTELPSHVYYARVRA
jgi:hypothetical protein